MIKLISSNYPCLEHISMVPKVFDRSSTVITLMYMIRNADMATLNCISHAMQRLLAGDQWWPFFEKKSFL